MPRNGRNDFHHEMSAELKVVFSITASLGIFFLLWFLGAMYRREAVKRDLQERACQPIRIWWVPFGYWASYWSIPFRVIYRDVDGRIHRAYCSVHQRLTGPPFGPLQVQWAKDELRDFIDV